MGCGGGNGKQTGLEVTRLVGVVTFAWCHSQGTSLFYVGYSPAKVSLSIAGLDDLSVIKFTTTTASVRLAFLEDGFRSTERTAARQGVELNQDGGACSQAEEVLEE